MPQDEQPEGKFNSGIATLMRIDKLMTKYADLSVVDNKSSGKAQHLRLIVLKNIFVQATPLIELLPEDDKKTAQDLQGTILKMKCVWKTDTSKPNKSHSFEAYDESLDETMYTSLIGLQQLLHKSFYPEGEEDEGL